MKHTYWDECRTYFESKPKHIVDGDEFVEGPSKDECLNAPLFRFPAIGFPITHINLELMMREYIQDLAYSPNPIDTIQNTIKDLESRFGIKIKNGDTLFNWSRVKECGLAFSIYNEVSTLSDITLLELLTNFNEIPDEYKNWNQDDETWLNLYKFIDVHVTNVLALQKLRGLLKDLKTGKPISQLTDTSKEDNSFEEVLVEHPTYAKAMSWLYELGIIDQIIERCTEVNETPNFRKAANIISSFTQIPIESGRKMLEGIYAQVTSKNNPLRSPDNSLYVDELLSKFRLNRLKRK